MRIIYLFLGLMISTVFAVSFPLLSFPLLAEELRLRATDPLLSELNNAQTRGTATKGNFFRNEQGWVFFKGIDLKEGLLLLKQNQTFLLDPSSGSQTLIDLPSSVMAILTDQPGQKQTTQTLSSKTFSKRILREKIAASRYRKKESQSALARCERFKKTPLLYAKCLKKEASEAWMPPLSSEQPDTTQNSTSIKLWLKNIQRPREQ